LHDFGPLALENGRILPSALERVDARHADFRGANLQRAVFRGTRLSSANLTGPSPTVPIGAMPICSALRKSPDKSIS